MPPLPVEEGMALGADGANDASNSAVDASAREGPAFSEELLAVYYQRLFPYKQMTRWLSYGNDPNGTGANNDKGFLRRREISFTLEDDIYIRYQSFRDMDDMKEQVIKKKPFKMDIGAVFNMPPKDHTTVKAGAFKPVERELVFDIDLTDYDEVRTCCSKANICGRCWGFMTMAIKVMDKGLRDDFGFKDLLWIYSGRRGVHCWVCDDDARSLSNEARTAVAHYFGSGLIGSDKQTGSKSAFAPPIHPSLQRAYEILEPFFVQLILGPEGQGLLDGPEKWGALLQTLPYPEVAEELDARWQLDTQSPHLRWKQLLSALTSKASRDKVGGSKKPRNAEVLSPEQWKYETVFKFCYPRLDINVSTHMNHLLKSPFVAHPKTGRVCVPIDPSKAEVFDPFTVPTLGQLAREIDDAGGDHNRTSLQPHLQYFDQAFLTPLLAGVRRRLRATADQQAAMAIDF